MPEIKEGMLVFLFPGGWDAGKYDAWAFYLRRFQKICGGAKAVDIVAVSPGPQRELWLIEVKDYRIHRRTKALDLPLEVALKVRDTLAGLAAAGFQADDEMERKLAARGLGANHLRIVLHLEQPAKHSKLFPRAIDPAKVLQKLKALLKAVDPHPMVIDGSECGRRVQWRVAG